MEALEDLAEDEGEEEDDDAEPGDGGEGDGSPLLHPVCSI
jgi:hypothetical protein